MFAVVVDVRQLLLEGEVLRGEIGTGRQVALLGRESNCSLGGGGVLLLAPGRVVHLGSLQAGGAPLQALAPIIVEHNFHEDDLLKIKTISYTIISRRETTGAPSQDEGEVPTCPGAV